MPWGRPSFTFATRAKKVAPVGGRSPATSGFEATNCLNSAVRSGPCVTGLSSWSLARSTALTVERLFNDAKQSVIVGGYSFDTPEILAPLHRGMRDRGVAVMLFLDIEGEAQTAAGAEAFATATIDRFFRDVWNFGLPKPDVYYDPRTAAPGPPWVSLHAKCVIVDDAKSFITSANFTDRGQTRNIEAGVLIDDTGFGQQLAGHWRQLVSDGLVHRYVG